MSDFLRHLFDPSDFSPRWHCGRFAGGLGWLHVFSDIAIAAAYYAIPLCLVIYVHRKKRDVPLLPIFWLFAAFIFFCGTTHAIDAMMFYYPAYRFLGVMKFGTAVVSIATVFALIQVRDQALALPGLHKINQDLQAEVDRRRETEAQMHRIRLELEGKVDELRVLAALVRTSADSVFGVAADGRILSCNEGAARMYGKSVEELTGQSYLDLVPEEQRQSIRSALARAWGGEAISAIETTRVGADGGEVFMSFACSPVFGEDGKVLAVSTIERDITASKQAENQLRASERRFRAIFESTMDCILLVDSEGRIVDANPSFLRIVDAESPDQVVGRIARDFLMPDERQASEQRLERLLREKSMSVQSTIVALTGKMTEIQWRAKANLVDDLHLAVGHDVTEQRLNERRLAISHRVTKLLTEGETMDDVRGALAQALCEATGAQAACFWQLQPGGSLHHTRSFAFADHEAFQFLEKENSQVHLTAGVGLAGICLERKDVVALHELSPDQRTRFVNHPENRVRHGIAFPVAGSREPFKVIELFSTQPFRMDESTREMLRSLGREIAQFMEKRASVEALRESERRKNETLAQLDSLLANAPIGLAFFDRDCRFAMINDYLANYINFLDMREVVGQRLVDILPSLGDSICREVTTVFERGTPMRQVEFVGEVPSMPGQQRHWMAGIFPVQMPSGHRPFVGLVITDITSRIRQEEALRTANQRISTILENISDAFISYDRDWSFTYVNKRAAHLLGHRTEELIGRNLHEVMPDTATSAHHGLVSKAAAEGKTTQFESYDASRDAWLETRTYPSPDGISIFISDISEKKKAEEALRRSLQRLDLVMESADIGLWYNALPLANLNWDERCRRHFGLGPDDEVSIELFYELIHPDDRESIGAAVEVSIRDRSLFDVEYRVHPADGGSLRWIQAVGRATYDASGTPVHFDGITIDITRQKQQQEALAESEARFREMADAAPVLIWVSDETGGCTYFNKGWLSFTGRTFEEEAGNGWTDGLHPEDRDRVIGHFQAALAARQRFSMEYRLRRHDGMYQWVLDHGIPRFSEGGQFFQGYIGSCIDITERKKGEEELKTLNFELEQFAYIASHDLKAPLRAVSGYVQLIERRTASYLDEETRRFMRGARDSVEQMGSLIGDLLAFSQIQRSEPMMEEIDLNEPMKRAMGNLRVDIEEANAVIDIGPLPRLFAQRTQMTQLFQNLIHNALKFRSDRRPEIRISAELVGNDWKISVADNGIGIDPRYSERIFEVFKRLHSTSRYPGTGIGLAICRKIVDRHGGRIWVESERGSGATFHFTLPRGKTK